MFIEVVNEDGKNEMIQSAHKQLHYMSLTYWVKHLVISNKTTRHIR
jgi:hypothetical protein